VSAIASSGPGASSTARDSFADLSMLVVDPRATAAFRPAVVTACGVAVALSIATTVRLWTDIDLPWLMVLALLTLLLACVLLTRASDTFRAEFSTSTHTLIVALTCLAGLLSAAAQWRGNSYLRDDWGQLSLGIVLLAVSPYRPVRHLVVAGVVSGGFVAALALCQSTQLPAPMSPVSFAIIAAVPVLSLSLAGAAYAHVAVRTPPPATSTTPGSVSKTPVRANMLSKDIEPFLRRIVEGDTISPKDAADAGRIADAIRQIMVAEANRSWLGAVVNDLVSREVGLVTPSIPGAIAVHDPARLSDAMEFSQRAAVRAVLATLLSLPGNRRSDLQCGLTAFRATVAVLPGGHKRLLLNATFTLPPDSSLLGKLRQGRRRRATGRSIRRTVNPLLALTASAFPWQDMIVDSSGEAIELTLRFSYGH
jgi:hypothetical protein